MKHTTLPPATSYHRMPIRIADSLLRILEPLGIGKADLSEHGLIEAARKATGLEFFGDESFRVPMRILLKAIEEEADLNPVGRHLTRQALVRILKHRLLAQDLFDRHPEIQAREIAPPVVIVGLARSGTTRLHRLLACDPAFLSLRAWESLNPVPWPESFGSTKDPRLTATEQGLKFIFWVMPQMAAVHPLGASEVEEEVGLIEHAFSSQLHEVTKKIPTFAKWLMEHDQTFAYAYMTELLKLVEWFRDDPPGKTWILKSPQHMQDLDALLNVFPEAKLIFSHRDPLKVVGSACSMTWNSIVRDTDNIDPLWVGQEWFGKIEAMLHKTLRVRETVPDEQQLDILYSNINEDWQREVEKIYAFLGRELTPKALANMEAWLASNKQHQHGEHRYSLADYGLDPVVVEERLRFYRERFQIPHESKRPRA